MSSKKHKHQQALARPEAVAGENLPAVMPAADPTGFADFHLRAMQLGFKALEQNIEFGARLMGAREVGEVLALQHDLAQSRAETMKADAAELNELALRMARETAETMQTAFLKSIQGWQRSFAA